MKRIIVFLVFIVFVFGVYYVKQSNDQEKNEFYYKDDFESLNTDFWYVGEWQTLFSANEKVKMNNGVLKLEVDEVDQGPVLLSKPIEVLDGQILTVKRRVRITHADDRFTGGFAILETSDTGVIPSALNTGENFLGNGVVLVEYVYKDGAGAKRPGNNVFRVLPRTWMIEETVEWIPGIFMKWFKDNYQLVSPVYGKWIEESLVFDNSNGTITYTLDGESYTVWTEVLKTNKVRLYMHSYGFGTGHSLEMDWLEVSVD